MSRSPKRQRRGRRSRKIMILLLLVSAITGGLIGSIFAYLQDLPQLKKLEDYQPSLVTRLYATNGEVFAEFFQEKRLIIPLYQIPKVLKEAILAVEDARFYRHRGLDIWGILRATIANIKAGHIVEGGSTITQQLTKILFLTPERTFSRKLKEAILALLIESRYTKDEILEIYCNQMYLGSGAYGVEAAAQTYFGKSARDLNLAEAALIAGLFRAPSRFSPFNHPALAKKRMRHVLRRMVEVGYITQEEADRAARAPLRFNPRNKNRNRAPYFAEYVRQYLERRYGSNLLYHAGLKVYTTLDLQLQRYAEEALRKGLDELNQRHRLKVRGEGKIEPVEGAIVVLDPHNGHIKAMVGGYDYNKSQFNRAVQAKRQPGSAFKPFIYLTALYKGYTPADIILDAPVSYEIPGMDKSWEPQNYTHKFYGPNTLRRALENSRNVSTVRLLDKIGVDSVIKTAKLLGLRGPFQPNLSLALGTSEISLLELTKAYGVFANQGVLVEPVAIRMVTDADGKVLERSPTVASEVVKPEYAYLITNMLKGVIRSGTGRRARKLKRPVAGKTGTTNNYQDAWFIGYTPQLVAGVWVGCDNHQTLGQDETGAHAALPIWLNFMEKALLPLPKQDFPVPQNITFVDIDPETGLLATPACPQVFSEAFIKGTEPTTPCYHGQRELHPASW